MRCAIEHEIWLIPVKDDCLDARVGDHCIEVEEDEHVAATAVQTDAADLWNDARVCLGDENIFRPQSH